MEGVVFAVPILGHTNAHIDTFIFSKITAVLKPSGEIIRRAEDGGRTARVLQAFFRQRVVSGL